MLEHGPLTADEITHHLYPDGMTGGRGGRGGDAVPVRLDRIRREHLTPLVNADRLVLLGKRYGVSPRLGTVLVAYFGTLRVHACVYDTAGGLLARHTSVRPRPIRAERDLKGLLAGAIAQLSGLLQRPEVRRCGEPRAMAVALPAALDPSGRRVVSADLPSWAKLTNLPYDINHAWEAQQRKSDIPDLPWLGGGLALTIHADVVADTIAAMYDRPPALESPHPSNASVVLGVKCSGGSRSTVIARGPRESIAGTPRGSSPRRQPGTPRDLVYRGAHGDTAGLGHSIALVHRARFKRADGAGWNDIQRYWDSLGDPSCSCGSTEVPHVDQLVSLPAIAKRLGVAVAADSPEAADDFRRRWAALGGPPDGDEHCEHVLIESGRLLGYALDTGVRLYDPQAVLVTGTVPENHVFWQSVLETADAAMASGLSIVRATELPSHDPTDPLGPRGAARLALDTWVYPDLLAGNWRATGHRPFGITL